MKRIQYSNYIDVIRFTKKKGTYLITITYHAKFFAREGLNRAAVCTYSCDLAIDESFQNRMQAECTEEAATFKGRLVLRRRPVTDTRTPNVESSRDLFESVDIRRGY